MYFFFQENISITVIWFHSCVLHPKSYLFCNWTQYLLTTFNHFFFFPTSYPLPLAAINLFSVSISPFFFLFFFNSIYITRFYSICISLCDLFHLQWCTQGQFVLSQMVEFPAFYGRIILCCVCVCLCLCIHAHTHFLYPFIYQWILRFFLCLGYCNYCCNEHGCRYFWGSICVSLGYMPRCSIVGSYGSSIIDFFEDTL